MTYTDKNMRIIVLLLFYFIPIACQNIEQESLVNPAHLQKLYHEIVVDKDTAAFVYIYAEYPEYKPIEATDEGIACADDIARAAVFYLRYFEYTDIPEYEEKARRLIRMLLLMQAKNGFFYNFLDEQYRIEKNTTNSQPDGNWWTWRALWAISEGYQFWKNTDPVWAEELLKRIKSAIPGIREMDGLYPRKVDFEGYQYPTWLPLQYAADQSAVLVMALLPYAEITQDSSIISIIKHQCEGMMQMQIMDEGFTQGAFLSWPGLWHAYGNSQADALLKAYSLLKNESVLTAAENELVNFYPRLEGEGFMNRIQLERSEKTWNVKEKVKFEQIAYGIRPMVWALLSSADIKHFKTDALKAADVACWLLGNNPADAAMYNPETGRCFDGINSDHEVNKNSGAESTIEALLTILEIEKNPAAKERFHSFYLERKSSK